MLIQVNQAAEPQKAGVPEDAVANLARSIRSLPLLSLRGLMTIPPAASTPDESRVWFARLGLCASALRPKASGWTRCRWGCLQTSRSRSAQVPPAYASAPLFSDRAAHHPRDNTRRGRHVIVPRRGPPSSFFDAKLAAVSRQTIGDLYLLTYLLRFVLQWVRADYYNPLAQFVLKVTNPLVVPARRLLPSAGGIDLPTLVVLIALEALVTWLLIALSRHTSADRFVCVLRAP